MKAEEQIVLKLCRGIHPNLIQVINLGEFQRYPYYRIDMELCALNLHDYIHSRQEFDGIHGLPPFISNLDPLDKSIQILNIITQVASGLNYIHHFREVHMSLKPSNSDTH